MTIHTDTVQILLAERAADLRREADRERAVRAARLARPRHGRRPLRPWWRKLGKRVFGAGSASRPRAA